MEETEYMQASKKGSRIARVMSACLAILLALSTAACTPSDRSAAGDFVEIAHIPAGLTTEFPRRNLVAFHGNDCWAYINDTLVRYDMEKREIAFTMPMALDVFAHQSHIDGGIGRASYQACIDIDPETGHLYLIRTDADENTPVVEAKERSIFLLELDRNGNEVRRWPLALGWNDYAEALMVINNRLFIFKYDDMRIREIDLGTGQIRVLDLPNVSDFARCKEGVVILMADDSGGYSRVGVYAPEMGTLVKDFPTELDSLYRVMQLVNTNSNVVYAVSSNGSVNRIDLETEQTEFLFTPSNDLGNGVRGVGLDNGKLHVLMANGQIDSYAKLEGRWDFGHVLRIMAPGSIASTTALPLIARNQMNNGDYPGMNITYPKSGDENQYYANVVKKLMAKDTDFDLFVIKQSDYSIFEKGMFEDLRQYPDIAAHFDQMLPGIADFASHEGKIIGYPILTQISLHNYNVTQLEGFGIATPPVFLTMAEYEALFDNANDSFATQKPATGMLPHALYRSLSTGYFTYEKELTEQDIAAFFSDAKRMVEKRIVSLNYQEPELFSSQSNNMFSRSQSRMIIPLDRADDPYSICADFLCVNPYSDNKEIALAYIKALSAPETEREMLDYFISDMMFLQYREEDDNDTEPNNVYNETSTSAIQAILENPPLLPLYDTEALHGIANYDLYKQLLARSTKEHKRIELGSYFSELLEKLCAGTIDEQTAAAGLYKKMRMIRDE